MPMNGFNTGRDVTIQIIGYKGANVSFALRTRFTARQDTNDIKVKGFDGIVRILRIPDGWNGTVDYTRQNNEVDDYIASLEADYYNGVDIAQSQITETIQNGGNAVRQYRYEGVMWKMDDTGDKTGDDVIKQRLSWMGSRRIRVV